MNMDIAIYKSIAHDRIEKIKNETYGKRTYQNTNQSIEWKIQVSMLLNIFV